MEPTMCVNAPLLIPSGTSATPAANDQMHTRSLAALMAGYPSTCSSTAFDQYSEYSDEGSDSSELNKPTKMPVKTAFPSKLCRRTRKLDEISTTSGDAWPTESADERLDSSGSSNFAGSGDESPAGTKKQDYKGESSTDVPTSKEVISDMSSDSETECFVKQKPMTPLVYPLTLMLQMRALIAACGSMPPASGGLFTKKSDEVAQSIPATAPKAIKSKRNAAPRQLASVHADDRVSKSIRAVLSGLTPDSVDATLKKLSTVGIQTVPQFSTVLRETVDRAMNFQQLAAVCADLLVQIKAHPKFVPAVGRDGEPNGFRQLLLDECWPKFQQFLQRKTSAQVGNDTSENRSSVGNIKLMGELMARGLISPRLLVDSAEALLNAFACNAEFLDALEALVALLMAACPRLDVRHGWVHSSRMDAVFARVHDLARKQVVPQSIRMLLRDLVALRERGWSAPGKAPCEELRACAGRPVDRELPKPKQAPRTTETPISGESTMLSLARDMLLAPVDTPTRRPTAKPQPIPQKEPKEGGKIQSAKPKPAMFNAVVFHRELSVTLRDLGSDGNIVSAVQRIQAQNVPIVHQAKEYADLLTRVSEISRKPVRQSAFAFAAGLASIFEYSECLAGVKVFFQEVYGDLCEEVPQLPVIVQSELLPSLKTVFAADAIEEFLPKDL